MSSTFALRLATLALIGLVGLTAAAPFLTCPNSEVTDSYAPSTTASCAAYKACVTTWCSCQGATSANTTTNLCVWGATRPSCDLAGNCTAAVVTCINAAASDSAACSNELSTLKIALMAFAGGATYSGTSTEKACQKHACLLYNASVTAPTCTNVSYSTICKAPYVYVGILTLSGDWSAILNNATAKAQLITSLQNDLTRILGFPVIILSLRSGSLIVEFQVPVSSSNTALQSNLATAGSSSSWLTQTQQTYASNGGQGSLSVTGLQAQTPAPPTLAPGQTTTPPPSTAPGGGVATTAVAVLAALAVALVVV